MPWDGLNRRRFPRVTYPCLVKLLDDETKEPFLTHTENLGIGGVCLITKNNIPQYTSVELEIDLLDADGHIRCKGTVVWNVRRKGTEEKKPLFYDIGIEFADITPEDKERIDQIVAKLVKSGRIAP